MNRMSRRGVGPSILMYHSIAEGSEDPYAVPPGMFQDQVSWLLEHGFEPVSLAAMVNLLMQGDYRNLDRKVAFTFDDGYRDFLTDALSVLLRHKVPATVFIVPGMTGEKASWSVNSRHVQLMAEDEIRHISSQGINLGSHSMTHANLTDLDQEELYRQLKDSRARLRDLGESFYALSYPWGQSTSQTVGAVKASGYDCAVTVGGEMRAGGTNLYCLPRITMRADMDLKAFQALFDRPAIKHARKLAYVFKRYFAQ